MAASVSGSIGISGSDTYNATGITFSSPAFGIAGSGSLASYVGSTFGLTSFSFASANGVELFFSPSAGPSTLTFTINGPVTIVQDDSSFLNVTGNGTFTETGFSDTTGTFKLTSTSNGQVTFTLDAQPTPEPNSLILMGSGLLSGAGMLLRRRRSIA